MRRRTGCYDRLNDQIARALADALFVLIGGEPHIMATRRNPARARLYLDQLRCRADWSASVAVEASATVAIETEPANSATIVTGRAETKE